MAGIRDSFVDLERHRLQLEQNVSKLRASLRHWQQWELEYEGMKEEVLALAENNTPADSVESLREDPSKGFLNNSNDILLTPKERKSLLVDDKGRSRDKQQLLGLLSRRIDYVQQNVKSVSSMLQAAEEKYATSQVLSQREVRNEEGLPFTEILEQLDEDDNVISSTVSKPGETEPQLMEALRKAGVNDMPKAPDRLEGPESHPDEYSEEGTAPAKAGNSVQSPATTDQKTVEWHRTNASPLESSTNDSPKRPKGPLKNVSFADDTKVDSNHKTIAPKSRSPARNTTSNQSLRNNPPRASKVLGKEIGQMSPISTGERKAEAATGAPFTPVIPTDESPEDAVLRRQMIQYNMQEVGAVVAELDLDEEGMSYSDGEDEDEEEEEDYPNENSSVEEDEDQFGRTRRRVLTDDYMAEMKALEKRLKNVGPNAEIGNPVAVNGHEERPSSDENSPNATPEMPKPPPKKGVRFAPSLDVQEAPPPPTVNSSTQKAGTVPKPPPKPSSNPVLSSIIERPYAPSTDTTTTPPEPDEYDPALLQQEVATEYHKMRNRMIARQGGFMAQDEDKAEVPLSEAEGGRKKVSRFKAARLGKT